MTLEEAFHRYRKVLQGLGPPSLHTLDAVVTKDVHFKDPFHDVFGADEMKAIYLHLFRAVEDLLFTIDHWACADDRVYFRWTLSAQLSGKPWMVTGVTCATFNISGRVTDHVEYWDAASQLYERFPVIGSLLRYVRRRISGH
jgi:hypothetical protein